MTPRCRCTRSGHCWRRGSVHTGRSADNHLLALAQTHGISRKRVDELVAVIGAGLYLTAVGLFGLGLAIVRNTAGGIAAFAGIMFVLPPRMDVLPTSWNNVASPYLPLAEGESIVSITDGKSPVAVGWVRSVLRVCGGGDRDRGGAARPARYVGGRGDVSAERNAARGADVCISGAATGPELLRTGCFPAHLKEAISLKHVHPELMLATVRCTTCGETFTTRSTRSEIVVETCSNCHPAYTGAERSVASGSRIERFERRRLAARR